MQESESTSPDSPEREEAIGKEFEVAQLVGLSRYIQDMIAREPPEQGGADYGFDLLLDYSQALAKRDPEIGHMLVEALETRSIDNPDPDYDLSDRLRARLGLPSLDELYGNDQ